MHELAIIPARAGSVGLPGKNLRKIDGVPLWRRAVEQGIRCAGGALLTTDIDEISEGEMPQGCERLARPKNLAQSDTPMAEVIKHAINTALRRDLILVLLQPTSPLRTDDDVRGAISRYRDGGVDLVMSVTLSDSAVLKQGTVSDDLFIPVSSPEYCFANRQALPPVYKPNGAIYVFSAEDFLDNNGFPNASIGAYVMPADRSQDIDVATDLFDVAKRISIRG